MTGESTTLIWNTTYADTLSIDQDLGTVEPDGTMTVYPLQTTTYTITATGSGGTATASATATVTHPITLRITEPLDGAGISDTSVTVRGTIAHTKGIETGLRVNGMPVVIEGDQFTANHVSLAQGENTITATATDASGLTLSDSITVDANMPENYIHLSASPVSGTSPFETTLRIDSSFAIASSQITYFGPDDVTYLDESIDEIRVQVTTEGMHTFAIEATDSEGNVYADEVTVQVVDKELIDELLMDNWKAMREALVNGGIEKAVTFFTPNRQAAYEEFFQLLPNDRANAVIPRADKMELVEVLEGKVRYVTEIDIVVNGVTAKAASFVIFAQDDNGLWKISFFNACVVEKFKYHAVVKGKMIYESVS
jgi:hypothetical protein